MPQIPVITKDPSGTWAMLAEDFTVRVLLLEITVYRGFYFDGASIPGLLKGLVGSPWDPLTLAAARVRREVEKQTVSSLIVKANTPQ